MSIRNIVAGAFCVAAMAVAPHGASAEPVEKIAFMEVIHSLFYSPLYAALGLGYFEDEGLEFDLVAAQGSDKATAALISGNADIVLAGPETAVYIEGGQSPEKIRIFAGLTATDGSFLVGREPDDAFDWSDLKGKTVLGWRQGSAPAIFFEKVLKDHGLDPKTDVEIITNVAIPARLGAFMAGTADYGTFFEPDVTKIEASGDGFALANVGEAAGQIDYTVFTATESYIAEHPEVIQGFTNAIARAEAWIDEIPADEVAVVLEPYFPGVDPAELASSVERQRAAGVWKTAPLVTPEAIDGLQELLIAAGLLEADKKAAYERLVDTRFAEALR